MSTLGDHGGRLYRDIKINIMGSISFHTIIEPNENHFCTCELDMNHNILVYKDIIELAESCPDLDVWGAKIFQ